jgi:molecular chaperone DnaK
VSKILGIDLGTTNSCMSVMEGGEPVVLENREGARTTPSVVAFTKSGERLVGQVAKHQAVINPTNTVFSVKRFMGRKFDELKDEDKRVPYKLVKAPNGDAHVELEINGQKKTFSPPEISAMILAKLKSDAEAKLGEKITKAVITVPAYFNDSQRNATKDAGKIAGLEVLRIINEPTAASLAYGLDKTKNEKIAVLDFGGGAFSVSILEIGDGVFEVKATTGDARLGGEAIDFLLVRQLFHAFFRATGIDLFQNPVALCRARHAMEQLRVDLSSASQGQLILRGVAASHGECHTLIQPLSRTSLEEVTADFLGKALKLTEICLADAHVKIEELSGFVLIGGVARMPKLRATLETLLGREPYWSMSLGAAVAGGAAILAGVLAGDVKDVLLLDVTPLTLAIETAGGIATPMIPRNTTIPTKKSQIFSTYSDNQSAISIKVLQGERPMAKDNKELGFFVIDQIPPALRGIPKIEVIFDIDPNGILNVSAKDLGTGKQQKISITGSSGLSKDEVDRMQKEAEAYAADL